MGRQKQSALQDSRPKRRATNAHIFRYLQTRNPSKLEENDLKRALEASLEEHPDFWPEDTASCSSSEQSNATSAISSLSSSSTSINTKVRFQPSGSTSANSKRRASSATMQQNHLNHQNHNHHHHPNHANSITANSKSSNRYKPVAKKNIYNEADFFHDGIMQYIEYELTKIHQNERCKEKQ